MKKISFSNIIQYLPSIILAVGSIYLAINGVSGWGWFLFISLLIFPSSGTDDDVDDDDDDDDDK